MVAVDNALSAALRPAPRFGEQDLQELGEVLGRDEEAAVALVSEGAVE